MQNNGNMTLEEHFYWIVALLGFLTLAVFITFANPHIHG